ncbi:MAG: heme-binding protein [Chlamydiae bacterium]|nr:heme-binding protein [Chlamydiota bacterium]
MTKKRVLTLAMARKIAEAAERKAEELKIKIVVSILDDGGNLKYFLRMDGTSYGSIRISQLKANTSASLPLSTRALAERNSKLPNGPYGGGAIPNILLLGGGLPILTSDGDHLGGIGISGATPDLDETCAQAGLDAIKQEL